MAIDKTSKYLCRNMYFQKHYVSYGDSRYRVLSSQIYFFRDLIQQNDCGKKCQKFLFQPNSTCFDNISFLKFCIKESFFTIDNMSQV